MTLDYQKVWNTMNDLEIVTSKICSAREIIDSAITALEEHKYEKAGSMIQAADEFLVYYLQEFDSKFKDAWRETVTKLKQEDPCITPWSTFWKDVSYSEEKQQYTEEELDAMCDKAASDEEKEKCREYNLREAEYYDKREKLDMTYDQAVVAGWTRTDDGFWIKEDKVIKWQLPIHVDGLTGDCYINFPDDLLEAANLKEGDVVKWVDNKNGTYIVVKVTEPLEMDDC